MNLYIEFSFSIVLKYDNIFFQKDIDVKTIVNGKIEKKIILKNNTIQYHNHKLLYEKNKIHNMKRCNRKNHNILNNEKLAILSENSSWKNL